AAGALEEGAINEKTIIEDIGTISAGKHTFGNWYFLQYGKTEGMLNIVSALKRSNDIFFYKTGEKLGEEKIASWAKRFGFGAQTGSVLLDEEGLIPTRFWKKEVLHEGWFLGDTYNLSIGQGYLLTTPLQINRAAAAFANGGYLCQPLVKKTTKGLCTKLPLSQKTIDIVQRGMKKVCLPADSEGKTGGTGWPFFNFVVKNEKIAVGCKTGTAQSHVESNLPHAWFTVFAPFEKPEIILTVLVEESGEGSNVAAPIAKEILKAYFERRE
ncbi:MAG: hypothetical protein EPN89_20100, partial [Methylovulum sp.]